MNALKQSIYTTNQRTNLCYLGKWILERMLKSKIQRFNLQI